MFTFWELPELLLNLMDRIISRIKNGNLEELDKVYLKVKPAFLNYATKYFPQLSIDDIEDAYHDAMILFYQNIQRGILTEIQSSLSAYIIQIGKIRLIKQTEQITKSNDIMDNWAKHAWPEDNYDRKIDSTVHFVLSKMNDTCKTLLELFYFEKKSMTEIAQLLGYKTADTVKSLKSRCINRFVSGYNELKNN